MKNQLIVIILILIWVNVSCQSEEVVKGNADFAEMIVEQICNELSLKNSNIEEYLYMAKDLIQNDNVFSKQYGIEIEANKEIARIEEKFDAYFKFTLRRECKEYRKEYDNLDKNYENKLTIREAYLNNENLMFDLFDDIELDKLVQYFEVKNEDKLKTHLEQMIVSLREAKKRTYLNTTKLNREEITFHNNFSDYISGKEKLRFVFVFNVTGKKIVKYGFNYENIDIVVN